MKLRIASLTGKWHDPDEVLLHAAFTCLENYVAESGGKFEQVRACQGASLAEIELIVDQNAQMAEAEYLYYWWQERKLRQDYPPDLLQWKEDTTMLQDLIALRGILWL